MTIGFICVLLSVINFSLQKDNLNNSIKINNNDYEIAYKTEKLLASNFTIKPNNEYYYEFILESMNFLPHDIFPAIYRMDLNALKDNQYYFAKVHFVDALGFSYNIRLTCEFEEESILRNLFLDALETENNSEKIFSKQDFLFYSRGANNTLIKKNCFEDFRDKKIKDLYLVIQPKIIAYQLNVANRPKQAAIILEFLELKFNIPNKIVIILTQKNLYIFLITVATLIFVMFRYFQDKIRSIL